MAYRLSALDLQRCYSSVTHEFCGPLPDLRSAWIEADAHERDEIFKRELSILNDSYKHLGLIGQLFLEAFEKTGCHEVRAPQDKQTPIFQGHNFSEGHKNKILYGGWSFNDREKFHDSSNHERTHAIQHASAAIAHALPFNGHRFVLQKDIGGFKAGDACRIVLTPSSYMQLEELKERAAYTMQKLLSDLRMPDFDPHTQLGPALQDYASKVLEMWDTVGPTPMSHLNYYRQVAMKEYTGMMLQPDGTPYDHKVLYVTMDAGDIAALGHMCGLTIFGDKHEDMSRWQSSPHTKEQAQWLKETKQKLGICQSPSFRDALKAAGMKPLDYLAACLGPISSSPHAYLKGGGTPCPPVPSP